MASFKVYSLGDKGSEKFGSLGMVTKYAVFSNHGRFLVWVSAHTNEVAATVYFKRYTKSGLMLRANANKERVEVAKAVAKMLGDSRDLSFVGL